MFKLLYKSLYVTGGRAETVTVDCLQRVSRYTICIVFVCVGIAYVKVTAGEAHLLVPPPAANSHKHSLFVYKLVFVLPPSIIGGSV